MFGKKKKPFRKEKNLLNQREKSRSPSGNRSKQNIKFKTNNQIFIEMLNMKQDNKKKLYTSICEQYDKSTINDRKIQFPQEDKLATRKKKIIINSPTSNNTKKRIKNTTNHQLYFKNDILRKRQIHSAMETKKKSKDKLYKSQRIKKINSTQIISTKGLKKGAKSKLQFPEKDNSLSHFIWNGFIQNPNLISFSSEQIGFSCSSSSRISTMPNKVTIENNDFRVDTNNLLRIHLKKEHKKRINAAMKIQKIWRGYQTRKLLKQYIIQQQPRLQQLLQRVKSQSQLELKSKDSEISNRDISIKNNSINLQKADINSQSIQLADFCNSKLDMKQNLKISFQQQTVFLPTKKSNDKFQNQKNLSFNTVKLMSEDEISRKKNQIDDLSDIKGNKDQNPLHHPISFQCANSQGQKSQNEEQQINLRLYRHQKPIYSHEDIHQYLQQRNNALIQEQSDFEQQNGQDLFHIIHEQNQQYLQSRKSSMNNKKYNKNIQLRDKNYIQQQNSNNNNILALGILLRGGNKDDIIKKKKQKYKSQMIKIKNDQINKWNQMIQLIKSNIGNVDEKSYQIMQNIINVSENNKQVLQKNETSYSQISISKKSSIQNQPLAKEIINSNKSSSISHTSKISQQNWNLDLIKQKIEHRQTLNINRLNIFQDNNLSKMMEMRQQLLREKQTNQYQKLNSLLRNNQIDFKQFQKRFQKLKSYIQQQKRQIKLSKQTIDKAVNVAAKQYGKTFKDARTLGKTLKNSNSDGILRKNKSNISIDLNLAFETNNNIKPQRIKYVDELQLRNKDECISQSDESDLQLTQQQLNKFKNSKLNLIDLDKNQQFNINYKKNIKNQVQAQQIIQFLINQLIFQTTIDIYLNKNIFDSFAIKYSISQIKPPKISTYQILNFIQLVYRNLPQYKQLQKRLNQQISPSPLQLLKCMRVDIYDDQQFSMQQQSAKYQFIIPQSICVQCISKIQLNQPQVIINKQLQNNSPALLKILKYIQIRQRFLKQMKQQSKRKRAQVYNITMHCVFDAWNEQIISIKGKISGFTGIGLNQSTYSLVNHNKQIQLQYLDFYILKSKQKLQKIITDQSDLNTKINNMAYQQMCYNDSCWICYSDQALGYVLELDYIITEELIGEVTRFLYKMQNNNFRDMDILNEINI